MLTQTSPDLDALRTDVNQLFDVALGMYDFQLVLMIAQYSQKVSHRELPLLLVPPHRSTDKQSPPLL